MFWDENYHIPSAQKHIAGVLYMEPHPPLGKMIMGLSEYVFSLNSHKDMSGLLGVDHAKKVNLPQRVNFFGFRFPSAFLMGLSVYFFYQIIFLLTRHRGVASIFSLFFIFDNALAVHTRAAMLEGIQIFFIAVSIWYLVKTLSKKSEVPVSAYGILGLFVGLAVAVKVNSLILLILLGIFIVEERVTADKNKGWFIFCKKIFFGSLLFLFSIFSVMILAMYLHIGMNSKIIDARAYKSSDNYINAIKEKGSWNFDTFIYGLKDHYRYHSEYARGVPRLDACKQGGENGSSWAQWPLGGKSINYRWKKKERNNNIKNNFPRRWGRKHNKNKKIEVEYSYLVVNPFIWMSAALGILLSSSLIISRLVYKVPIKDERLFRWMLYFTMMYICYLIAISQIDRVMYLYHYFIPLIFSIINLSLLFTYLYGEKLFNKNIGAISSLMGILFVTVGVFIWFSPLTYSLPLSAEQFEQRNWLPIWKMQAVK